MKGPDKAKKKGLLSKLIERLDKRLEDKLRQKPCCDSKSNGKGKSCCSR